MVWSQAHTNIALIKYWGKALSKQNIPATDSISLTLDSFWTRARAEASTGIDKVVVHGEELNPVEEKRVLDWLQAARSVLTLPNAIVLETWNNVPKAAGLASSASAFAAMATALARVSLGYDPRFNSKEDAIKEIARLGSGSALRSLQASFVRLRRHGSENVAIEKIDTPLEDEIRVIALLLDTKAKKIGSREGMKRVAESSAFYEAWLSEHPTDVENCQEALEKGDWHRVGALMESSTLKMHATCMAATPPFWYFQPDSIKIMNWVTEARLKQKGLSTYFTMDAGANVKIFCLARDLKETGDALQEIVPNAKIQIASKGPKPHEEKG